MDKRSKKGPIYKDDIPYDYIVIIDAGSKGSRVFVYNWLNPAVSLEKGYNMAHPVIRSLGEETDSDSDDDDNTQSEESTDIQVPRINTKKKWKTKIKPGISTFAQSPQKIGKHHLKYLLKLAEKVVPESQHSRTPIFLHSTAGMRLLTPSQQQTVLDEVCEYFTTKSKFYLPDCSSHINVIEGDIEGLYGWLSSNYLMGSFDHPQSHQHGKGHTTYGLLDMGGASTQVVFQPNTTETEEHKNNLYKFDLFKLPIMEDGKFKNPENLQFDVYSDSYLGLGMTQAYEKYLKSLTENSSQEGSNFLSYKPPINDPCLPKGYTTSRTVDDENYDFTGDSDFQKCLLSIFPVLSKGAYGHSDKPSGNCQQYDDQADVSSCLLNDLIPAFDFDINYFLGVSGYWYATSKLMDYNEKRDGKNVHNPDKFLGGANGKGGDEGVKGDEEKEDEGKDDQGKDDEGKDDEGKDDEGKDDQGKDHAEKGKGNGKDKGKNETYDYKVIYDNTSKLCSKSYAELMKLNEMKSSDDQLHLDELASLCFKSTWILNFLHVGLGFPRFGIDEVKSTKFKSLEFVDKINGQEFSWTLGRALLYANDEYIQAYSNFTQQEIKRSGFTYSASPNLFHYGSEQNGVAPRPVFNRDAAGNEKLDVDTDDDESHAELKWYIQPHRWYGVGFLGVLLLLIFWLLIGKQRRTRITNTIATKIRSLKNFRSVTYTKVREDLELNDLGPSSDNFVISYDEGDKSSNV